MKWINNILARIRARRLVKKLSKSPIAKIETELPEQYLFWIDFWNQIKQYDTQYVTVNRCYWDNYILYGTDEPLDYEKEHIKQQAIKECIDNEEYELAEQIKNE